MIIAVKGHSSPSTGSGVAAELANYLKYSLISPDDVAPALRGYLPSSSNQALSAISQDLDNLSFKIVYQIASAQLRSKLGVVINLPLSTHTHFDQLKQLANSQGVELLLVQCRSPDEIVDGRLVLSEEIVDKDAGVRKLTVDTNKPFDVESFISENLSQAFPQGSDLQPKVEKVKIPKDNMVKTSSLRPSRENLTEQTYRHLHGLTFYNKPTNDAARLCCKRCRKSVSGPNYQCVVCDDYIFHKSCAELPEDLGNCPQYLISKEPEYHFLEKQRCKICERNNKDFSDGCHDCLFETNMEGKFLPIVVNHEAHAHPLNLIIVPLSYNYEYGCCGCGKFGKSISYRCYDCNFNLHVSCVLSPRIINNIHHREHPLRLSYDSFDENFGDKNYCNVCGEETNPRQWFYYCNSCRFVMHIGCILVLRTNYQSVA